MADEHHAELIHRVLDGEAAPEECRALEALLARSVEARALHDDLAATAELLAQVEMVAPPRDLKGRVMRALPASRYVQPVQQRPVSGLAAVRAALSEVLAARPAFALAYAMVLGAVVGAATWSGIAGAVQSPTLSETVGTMSAPEDAALLRPIETLVIDVHGVEGVFRLMQEGGLVSIELELVPLAETEIKVTFNPEHLHWESLTRLDNHSSATLTARAGEALLTISSPAHYLLSFNAGDRPTSLTLSIHQGGATLYRRTVSGNQFIEG